MKLLVFTILAFCLAWSWAQTTRCNCESPLRVGQFDVNQAPFAPFKQQRLTATSNFIRNSNYDVLCLESLWVPSEKTLITNRARPRYRYSYSPPRKISTCNARCGETELNNLITCTAGESCHLNTTVANVFSCINSTCADEFSRLSPSCRRCLGGTTEANFEDRLTRCAGFRVSGGQLTSCRPLYAGNTDVLVLSRYPFNQTDFLHYTVSPGVAWSVAYVRIIHPTFGPVNIFATHLVGDVPFTDFSQENLAEAQQLITFARSKVANRAGEVVLLVGNFNSGPRGRGLTAVFPNTYNFIVSSGYVDSTTRRFRNPPCTACSVNPLLGTTRVRRNAFIDHIFINGNASACVANAGTFATGNSVRVPGRTGLVPLSDHYGLFTEFCRSNTTIVRQTATIDAAGSESETEVEEIIIEDENNDENSSAATLYTYGAPLLAAIAMTMI